MGNCCSFKRSQSGDFEETKILQELTSSTSLGGSGHSNRHSNSHHHIHHHHHHGISKRHSNNSDLKPLNGVGHNNNSSHHQANKRNSLKQQITIADEDMARDHYSNTLGGGVSGGTMNTISSSGSLGSSSSQSSTSSLSYSSSGGNKQPNEMEQNLEQQHYYPKTTGHIHSHSRQLSTEKVGSSFGPQFKTPLSSLPQHMRMEGFQRAKHNSTSSLYIKSTLSTPDNDEILRCMACALLYHIERGTQSQNQKTFDIFSEEKYPITKQRVETKIMPTVEVIYRFVRDIFKAERLDSECAIMCLAYIERIIALSGITINPASWRRIVLSSLILASKVWEDQSVWNVDFLPVFDNLTATDLNNLERQFLSLIQYNISLTTSVYAKYYFELRTFSKLDSNHFPLRPLDKIGAKRLEDHSLASESRVKTFKRSASVDQINPPELHTRAVLN